MGIVVKMYKDVAYLSTCCVLPSGMVMTHKLYSTCLNNESRMERGNMEEVVANVHDFS